MIMIILCIVNVILLISLGGCVFYLWKIKHNSVVESSEEADDFQVKYEQKVKELDELKKQFNETKSKAQQIARFQMTLINEMRNLNESIEAATSFEEKIRAIRSVLFKDIDGQKFFFEYVPSAEGVIEEISKFEEIQNMIKNLGEKVTDPFLCRLSEEQLQPVEVRELVVKMAMQLYDGVSYMYCPSRSNYQRLNNSVVNGLRSEEEAYQEAEVISDVNSVTPMWIRNLTDGLRGLELEDKKIIYSNYRLSDDKQSQMLNDK